MNTTMSSLLYVIFSVGGYESFRPVVKRNSYELFIYRLNPFNILKKTQQDGKNYATRIMNRMYIS